MLDLGNRIKAHHVNDVCDKASEYLISLDDFGEESGICLIMSIATRDVAPFWRINCEAPWKILQDYFKPENSVAFWGWDHSLSTEENRHFRLMLIEVFRNFVVSEIEESEDGYNH